VAYGGLSFMHFHKAGPFDFLMQAAFATPVSPLRRTREELAVTEADLAKIRKSVPAGRLKDPRRIGIRQAR
jgi:hypothetical protein